MKTLALIGLAVTAAALAKAQGCYQFSAPGITLQINVDTILFQSGPTDGVTFYSFSGSNSFTQGGATQTSSEIASGSINITYLNIPGLNSSTSFEMVVPNADTSTVGDHFWTVNLGGLGNLIPGQVLPAPSALPPLSAWTGVANTNILQVTHGGAPTTYPLTAVGPCGSSGSGSGGSGSGGSGGGSTSATSPLQNLGDPNSLPGGCNCGEPVNLATGNVYYEVTDYKTAGANPLQFTRSYNSLGAASGNTFAAMLGPNWRSNYDRYLRFVSSTSVIAERPDGQQVTFTLNGSAWTTDPDIDLALVNSGTGAGSTWTLTDHSDNVETYSNSGGDEGVLQTIQARNGYTQTLTYIGGNQLSTVQDSYGRALALLVNNGLLQSVQTADATVLSYGFTSGALTSVSYQTSPATSQKYVYGNSSFPNALTAIVDENGSNYISWTYDSMGRAITGQFAGGAGLNTFTYNSDGSRTVANALGETETYKFTTLQNVSKVIEVDRQASSTTAATASTYTYDSNGYTASYTDWNGNLTTFANDAHGQPTSITEASGTPQARTTTITYLSNFHLPSQIVSPGVTTSFTYDSHGQALTRTLTDTTATSVPYSTNGKTRTWTFTYANSLMTSVTTPRSDVVGVTKFGYDATGSLTSITNALGQTLQISQHLPGGLPQTMVEANGVTINLAYDPRQRLIRSAITTAAGVLSTAYTRDDAGNLTGITLPDGSALTASYDAAHRLTGLRDLFNQQIQLTLDGLGDVTKTSWIDAGGATQRTHSAVFDALGRMLEDIGGANQTTHYAYDANGNATSLTDPLGHKTQRTFDALNRLSSSTNAAHGTNSAGYDAQNRVVSATDPNGVTTTYLYDGFGDLIQQSSPATGSTTYRYDADGNCTQRVDARGVTVNAAFDALDRMISVSYPGDSAENVTLTYDQSGHGFGIGRLTSLSDAAGTLSLTYDERGNELTETRVHGGATMLTGYTYDAASRIASIQYPSDTVVYARDKMGRVASVTEGQAGAGARQPVVTAVTYQPFGPVTGLTYGNGIVETRSYDQDYRLTKLSGTGSAEVQSLTYALDAGNNVLSITDGVNAANSQSFGYDVLNRLTTAAGGYGSLAYSYDSNGNRTQEGSLPAAMDGLGQITGFSYNQAGWLASTSQGSQQIAQYTYDAFGHRLAKQTSAASVYLYDQQGRLLEEADGQGNPQTDYVYLDGRPIAAIEQSTGGQLYFLHDDRLGTPQVATDQNNKTAWAGNYLPFGGLNAATSQTAILAQDLRLPGQISDIETGLYQNGFRYYAPALGRYSQSDPLGLAGGSNTYAYAQGNPLLYVDPWGLCTVADAYNALATALSQAGTSLETFFQNQEAIEQQSGFGQLAQYDAHQVYSWAQQEWQQYGPTAQELNGIYGFFNDIKGALEGELGSILNVETTILRQIFGPLPTYTWNPSTQQYDITPAKP